MRTSERRHLKQDRFAQTTGEIISEAVAHSRSVIITAVIAAIILVVAMASSWYWNYRNQQANLALGKAMESYNAPLRPPDTPAPKTPLGLLSPARRSGRGRRISNSSKLRGSTGLQNPGRQLGIWQRLLRSTWATVRGESRNCRQVADSRNHDIAALAKLALAGVYSNSNRSKEALQLYQYLVSHPTDSVSKEMAELELASLYTASNQGAEATKVYNQLIKDNPKGAAAGIAQQRMQALK